jgi:hypothetical protein
VPSVVEAVAAAALSDLNQLVNEPYMAYLKGKLGEWPQDPPASKQRSMWTNPCQRPAADDQEEATKANALSGGGDGGGFVLDK